MIKLDGSFSGDTRIYCPRCFDSGNIVSISGNIFLYPPQSHPILYNYPQTCVDQNQALPQITVSVFHTWKSVFNGFNALCNNHMFMFTLFIVGDSCCPRNIISGFQAVNVKLFSIKYIFWCNMIGYCYICAIWCYTSLIKIFVLHMC